MSVSTAMYAAITGLNAMGTAMSVISNNIANVNTVGFKASKANFADVLSQTSFGAGGAQQIGRGVSLGAVTQVFGQGSFQNSAQDTSIAISGQGFFQVRDPVSNELFYTRAGNFILDKDGRMVLPSGHVLQGWELNQDLTHNGVPQDVVMAQYNAPPEVTTSVNLVANLDARSTSLTQGVDLSSAWDGTNTGSPISGDAYVYQTSIRVYDDLGGGHDLSIYFDPTETENVWEYIITCDPSEDLRTDAWDATNNQFLSTGTAFSGTAFAGLLQRGTITFDPESSVTQTGGRINTITAETMIDNNEQNVTYVGSTAAGEFDVLSASANLGTYSGTTNPADVRIRTTAASIGLTLPDPNAQFEYSLDGGTTWSAPRDFDNGSGPYTIGDGVEFTLGAGPFAALTAVQTITLSAAPNWQTTTVNNNGYFTLDAGFLSDPTNTNNILGQNIEINLGARDTSGTGTWVLDNQSTTQYSAASTTLFQTQDGFASGYLQRVSIDADGVLTGSYSNGRNFSVYQIGLALFRNQWGLDKVGNNLYAATRTSGDQTINSPGTGGTGTIAPNAIEQSNVDLADEFVDMIIQQRGFQANSKVITTTDTMLAELINLKR